MATYEIAWRQSALRELKRLDRQVVPRVINAVEALAKNPLPAGVRKLQGGRCTYRLRVGDYRVIYELSESRLIIDVVRVRHRKDAYR